MISSEAKSVIERVKQFYEHHKDRFEAEHRDRYVAIEPESGDDFIADTFDEAVRSARAKHPRRLSHTIRIGHVAAFHIGLMV